MKASVFVALVAGSIAIVGCGLGDPPAVPTDTPAVTTSPAASHASTPTPAAAGLVGIMLPTKSSERWVVDGDILVKTLEELGYEADLLYADHGFETEASQVEMLVAKGADAIVIAAVDGTNLADALQNARDAGVKVLAYDRLIRNTANVQYHVSFDAFGIGVLQANSIVDALDLRAGAGPFNVELFAGSPDDDDAGRTFGGAMSVLVPFLDSGKLVVRSGEVTFPEQLGTLHWSGASAQARMDNLLAAFYADGRVDAVLSPSDGMSRGITTSLKQAGYYTPGQPAPVTTGRDAELLSVRSILAGEQTSTVFVDNRSLARQAAAMVDQMLKGETVDVNDTRTYENGVKVIPSFLLDGLSVTRDDVGPVLVESGYYTADDLQ